MSAVSHIIVAAIIAAVALYHYRRKRVKNTLKQIHAQFQQFKDLKHEVSRSATLDPAVRAFVADWSGVIENATARGKQGAEAARALYQHLHDIDFARIAHGLSLAHAELPPPEDEAILAKLGAGFHNLADLVRGLRARV